MIIWDVLIQQRGRFGLPLPRSSCPLLFTIRGDCELGLCLNTMLMVEEFAALLFIGGFVNVKEQMDGGYTVEMATAPISRDNAFTTFLEDHELYNQNDVQGNIAEATKTKVAVESFKRRKKGTKIGKVRRKLYLLHVGKDEKKGPAKVASKQLLYGIDPPNFSRSRRLRTAQQELHIQVQPYIQPLLKVSNVEDGPKIEAIADWIRMKELEEDSAAYGDGEKNGSVGSTNTSASGEGGDDAPSHSTTDDAAISGTTGTDDTPSTAPGEGVELGTTQPTEDEGDEAEPAADGDGALVAATVHAAIGTSPTATMGMMTIPTPGIFLPATYPDTTTPPAAGTFLVEGSAGMTAVGTPGTFLPSATLFTTTEPMDGTFMPAVFPGTPTLPTVGTFSPTTASFPGGSAGYGYGTCAVPTPDTSTMPTAMSFRGASAGYGSGASLTVPKEAMAFQSVGAVSTPDMSTMPTVTSFRGASAGFGSGA